MTEAELVRDGVFSVKDASDFSKLSRSELYLLMQRRELAFLKHGRRRLIPKRALVALLAAKLGATK